MGIDLTREEYEDEIAEYEEKIDILLSHNERLMKEKLSHMDRIWELVMENNELKKKLDQVKSLTESNDELRNELLNSFDEIKRLKLVIAQYRDDLSFPLKSESIERRLKMIEEALKGDL